MVMPIGKRMSLGNPVLWTMGVFTLSVAIGAWKGYKRTEWPSVYFLMLAGQVELKVGGSWSTMILNNIGDGQLWRYSMTRAFCYHIRSQQTSIALLRFSLLINVGNIPSQSSFLNSGRDFFCLKTPPTISFVKFNLAELVLPLTCMYIS